MCADRTFVVYAPRFNEDSGGSIALHRLVDLLNRTGHRAFVWPNRRPRDHVRVAAADKLAMWRWRWREWRKPFVTHPSFDTPLATDTDLEGAIVVYPETVRGNPLQSPRVVRWLLHKPGFHKGHSDYGPEDRFFFYQRAFDDPRLNPSGADNLLKVSWVRDDVYHPPIAEQQRHGTAVLWRKGHGRQPIHDPNDAVVVDGLSHGAMAEVLRRVRTFVCYDLYTMYSLFAALCGCDSVVVPDPAIAKEHWYPNAADRYGIAYGFDDVDWARATRPLLLPHLKAQESAANATVDAFVEKCRAYFP